MARPAPPPAPLSFKEKVKRALLGEKGSGLPEYEYEYGLGYLYAGGAKGVKAQKARAKAKAAGKGKGGKSAEVTKQENPVARLKLLLVRRILILHT